MNSKAENPPPQTVSGLLQRARQALAKVPGNSLDAELLLAHACGKNRTWLHTWPELTPAPESIAHFEQILQQRADGMPAAYLTGEKEFWSLKFKVNAATLVPRPETECLVSRALSLADDGATILDLGTGSGAIAIAMAHENPALQVIATDISTAALSIASSNAKNLNAPVHFAQTDWLEAIRKNCCNMIVSNPPYVAAGDPHLTGDGVAYEPAMALVGGSDGMDAYRNIIPAAAKCLKDKGWLLLEHGADQAAPVVEILAAAGFEQISSHLDDARRPRISCGRRP